MNLFFATAGAITYAFQAKFMGAVYSPISGTMFKVYLKVEPTGYVIDLVQEDVGYTFAPSMVSEVRDGRLTSRFMNCPFTGHELVQIYKEYIKRDSV